LKRLFKQLLPSRAKLWIREQGARLLEIPWTRHNVPLALTKYLAPGRPISLIDVGASQGEFTLALQRYCGLRKAMLIEPQPLRIAELKEKFQGSGFLINCAAASSESRVASMEVLNWDYSSSLLPIRRDVPGAYGKLDMNVREVIPVRVASLDELCRDFDGRIDLLKIDVQGAEAQVIEGASKMLERVDLIWMEVSFKPLYDGSDTLEGMNRLCNRQGFVLTHLEEGFRSSSTGELLQADVLFIRDKSFRGKPTAQLPI